MWKRDDGSEDEGCKREGELEMKDDGREAEHIGNLVNEADSE